VAPLLTRRQREIYELIAASRDRFPYPPSLAELCRALGLASRGSLHKHLRALTDAGLIEPMNRKRRGIRLAQTAAKRESRLVPMLGYIAAGRPIEAVQNAEPIEIPRYLCGDRPSYVLQVRGESMIDEAIRDGDRVVVESRDHADNGEIVVALIDGREATLKRLEQRRGRVILHPANAAMQPMELDPRRVVVQGVVTGLVRSYRRRA
jgi:repressor LexA